MKLYNAISLCAMGAWLSLSSCSYYERFDTIAPDSGVLLDPTTTLAQVKEEFMTNDYLLFDNANHAPSLSNKYADMFTGYKIPKGASCIINAVVVSSDVEGNTYKKMVLRDLQDGSALDISIDAGGLSGLYPQGQRVSVICDGLEIGDYANSPVLGTAIFNNDSKRLRQEIGRLPLPIAKKHIIAAGMPDTSLVKPENKTIAEIKAMGRDGYGRLVRIKNVKFGYYVKNGQPDFFESPTIKWVNDTKETNIPFSHENSLNVPVSRALSDATGTINLTTSSYANFAPKSILMNPTDKDGKITATFDIIAIVGWYCDQKGTPDRPKGSYQLSLQRFSDIIEIPVK